MSELHDDATSSEVIAYVIVSKELVELVAAERLPFPFILGRQRLLPESKVTFPRVLQRFRHVIRRIA
jgi:hypothetical protein